MNVVTLFPPRKQERRAQARADIRRALDAMHQPSPWPTRGPLTDADRLAEAERAEANAVRARELAEQHPESRKSYEDAAAASLTVARYFRERVGLYGDR